MLLRILTTAVFVATLILAPSLLSAQSATRVPSGNLSDFFSPPGVKSASPKSNTRSLGSGTLKSDSVLKKDAVTKTTTIPSPTPEPEEKTTSAEGSTAKPEQPEDGSSKGSSSQSSGRVVVDTKNDGGEIAGGVGFGKPTKMNWRVGIGLLAGTKAVQNMTCRIPVPVQWPEQTVSVFEENLPSEITDVSWEDLDNIRLMKFSINNVAPGQRMIATVTFTVSTSPITKPKNTSIFRIPEKRTREFKSYFGESPGIDIRNTKLKKQAKLLFENTQSDWGKVEGIYNWILANIEETGDDPKGSLDAFVNKTGAAEDRAGLFVAMCRINKVPARMVFVHGTQYAEFYLVDDKQQGHWFPCSVTGIPEFGSISEPKIILQKGDNYRVPGEKQKLKFVPEKATWKGAKPRKMGFLRQPLAVN